MLTQVDIARTVRQGKFHTSTLLQKIVDKRYYGEKQCKEQCSLVVLTKWIEILEEWLDNNYDSDGNITSLSDCLDSDDINLLVSKVKVLIGNYKYPVPDWCLSEAYWNDEGYYFEDANNIWRDSVNFS